MTTRVIDYARASTNEQTHSVPGQLRDLGDHHEREGHEVVAAVRDQGEKRHTLERPGIEELRHLCATKDVDEIWAWAWDRYGEFPQPEVLALEMADFGVSLWSHDDGGAGEDSYEMRAIKSLFSRREQRQRVARATRGRKDKALRGQLYGGFRSRYGFRFVKGLNQKGQKVNTGYEVDHTTMPIVVRIFEMVAAGESLHAVSREFEQGGVPNPSGGPRWSRTTIKNVVLDDVYRPLSFEEIKGLVPPGVAAGLDPSEGKVYGVHWSGRKRSRFASSRAKKRTVYEAPREERVAVPIDLAAAGLDRSTVDMARAQVKDNKSPSKVGRDRFWELSGGLLRCAHWNRAMITYRRKRGRDGSFFYYYRCRPSSTIDRAECPNRDSHRAEALERDAAMLFERHLGSDGLLELYDRAVEEEDRRTGRRGSPERRAALTERLETLFHKRRGFQDQQAEGLMTLDELRERLGELDEQREAITAELRASEDAADTHRKRAAARALIKGFIQQGWKYHLRTGEGRHRDYRRVGARFEVDQEGTLTMYLDVDLAAGGVANGTPRRVWEPPVLLCAILGSWGIEALGGFLPQGARGGPRRFVYRRAPIRPCSRANSRARYSWHRASFGELGGVAG